MEIFIQTYNEPIAPSSGSILSQSEVMRCAVALAYQGVGRVSPNPLVGSVITDAAGRPLAFGHHEEFGGKHAEANALDTLARGTLPEDAVLYVTLEPCCHTGKQPPCTERIIASGIKKVVFGAFDPNPLMNGRGIEALRKAGVECKQHSTGDTDELIHTFAFAQKHHAPFVALKVATDYANVFAGEQTKKLWITNQRSREVSHGLRAFYDGIVVGKETVLLDNPILNTRLFPQKVQPRKVIILDPRGETLEPSCDTLNIRQIREDIEPIWVLAKSTPKRENLLPDKVIYVSTGSSGGFDLDELLSKLFERGIHSLLLEGGGQVHQSFLQAGKVQRIYHFRAPHTLDIASGRCWQHPKHFVKKSGFKLEGDSLDIYEN